MAIGDFEWSRLLDNQIRILTLKPGAYDDAVRFILTKHPVDDLPPYEALSYAWGEGKRDNICLCQDERSSGAFKITNNLFQALKQLRHKDEDRLLWIDQICIDQTDQDEKPQQIRLMSTIYRQAAQVVVWLGPADAETSLVFSLIDDIIGQCVQLYRRLVPEGYDGSNLHSYLPLELKSTDAPEWGAYRRIFKRSWFTRLWVFQELALSKSAIIVCGEWAVGWLTFSTVLDNVWRFDMQHGFGESRLKGVGRLCSELFLCNHELKSLERSSETSPVYLTLLGLVATCMGQQTSEPSDKVYGLLGLAQDIENQTFPINYRQHFRDTYIDVSRLFIQQHGDLNVLKLVILDYLALNSSRHGPRMLPSWVPDYRYGFTGRDVLKEISRKVAMSHGKARPCKASGASRTILTEDDYGKLTLEGILVGKIVSLSEEDGNMNGVTAIGRHVLPGGQWSQLAKSVAVGGIYLPTREPIDFAYQRLYFRDCMLNDSSVEDMRKRLDTPIVIPEPGRSSTVTQGPSNTMLDIAPDDSAIRVICATTDQRLAVTDNGYIGLVHHSCVVGDSVFILMGGDMPCVLRKLATGTYAFQGEAYVHGIMDGEFLLKHFNPHRPSTAPSPEEDEWLDTLSVNPLPFDTETVVLS